MSPRPPPVCANRAPPCRPPAPPSRRASAPPARPPMGASRCSARKARSATTFRDSSGAMTTSRRVSRPVGRSTCSAACAAPTTPPAPRTPAPGLQLAAVRASIEAEAADAYLQARGYQARLAVARGREGIEADLLKLVKERLAEGISAEREAHQTEAALEAVRAAIPPLAAGLEAQLNRLDVLMGAQPGTYRAELTADAALPQPPGLAQAIQPGDLMRRRPDVLAAEQRLIAANARIGAAISDYYPKISLGGLFGAESLDAGKLFTGPAQAQQLSAGFRWRIFDFGRVDAEVAGAKGRRGRGPGRLPRHGAARRRGGGDQPQRPAAGSPARPGAWPRSPAADARAAPRRNKPTKAGSPASWRCATPTATCSPPPTNWCSPRWPRPARQWPASGRSAAAGGRMARGLRGPRAADLRSRPRRGHDRVIKSGLNRCFTPQRRLLAFL